MEIKEIMEIIPHRPPFLLIDRVLELEAGSSVTALKNVTMNEYFFAGHFPAEPVMPGVLIIEALAQAGAVALLSLPEYKGRIAYFAAIDKAKFRAKVVPGDTLTLRVEIIKLRAKAGVGKAVAFCGDKKAAEAEITFMIR